MPIYKYQIKNKSGKISTGEIKSDNRELLEKNLVKKGYEILSIAEKNAFNDISQLSIFKPKVTTKDLAIFCRMFAIVLDAGVPIAKAVDVIRVQTVNPTLKEAIATMHETIQKGAAMSVAMRQFKDIFPQILINMIEAGEVSGKLELVLERLAVNFEKEVALNNKIKKATTYPIVVLVVAVAVVMLLMVKVVPDFIVILGTFNVELPVFTKILIVISDFFKNNIIIILATIFGTIFAFISFKKSESGKIYIDRLLLKIPVIQSVIKNIITARFTRSLGILLSSGVLMIQSMEVVQKIMGNAVIVEKMSEVIDAVKKKEKD
jgi:type IV pilus assembly protein PilC